VNGPGDIDDDDAETRVAGEPEDTEASTAPGAERKGAVERAPRLVAELRAVLTSGERNTLPLYDHADEMVVGRAPSCAWVLNDPSLGRQHARFFWSGHELGIEDLGAGTTRVNGAPVVGVCALRASDLVQLGTVVISFEAVSAVSPSDSTNLTSLPGAREAATAPSGPHNFVSQVTTMVPSPSQDRSLFIYRPRHDAASPEEPTVEWDPEAVHKRAQDKLDRDQVVSFFTRQWRTRKRLILLCGAAVAMASALLLVEVVNQAGEDDPFANTVSVRPLPGRAGKIATPDDLGESPSTTNENAVADETKVDETAELAIQAYEQGKLEDALRYFRALSDLGDEAARLGVEICEARLGGAK
jgi:pSer/pThr/pTyr-binding forkhead associated (FHA) protein